MLCFQFVTLANYIIFLALMLSTFPQDPFILRRSREKYIYDLLLQTQMVNYKPCFTLMATSLQLTKNFGEPFEDVLYVEDSRWPTVCYSYLA